MIIAIVISVLALVGLICLTGYVVTSLDVQKDEIGVMKNIHLMNVDALQKQIEDMQMIHKKDVYLCQDRLVKLEKEKE